MAEEILDGVHDITVRERDGRRFRVYFVEADVPTLIDTGFADTSDRVISELNDLGVEPERLIITHEDADHSGAFDAIVDEYDPETWVPADDADAVEADSGVEVDNRYGDGDTIGPYEVVHAPGHTPGSSVLIDGESDLAITGDVVWGADERGLPAGYLIPPPEIYSDYIAQAERSLENLLGHEFETALVFHGSAVMEEASDRLSGFVDFPGKPDRE